MKNVSRILFIFAKQMLGKVGWAFSLSFFFALCATSLSAAQFAYVTNYGSDNVSVIDTATDSVVGSIPVGTMPTGVAITPSGAFAYVTNYGSASVSVIATATNSVVNTITVGANPFRVAISPDGAFVYVTNFGSDSVSVIATATNSVVNTIAVGANPVGVAITPDGAFTYVANFSSGTLSVIDTETYSVIASLPAGGPWYPIGGVAMPWSVAITPDGDFVYATNYGQIGTWCGFSVTETMTNSLVGTYPFWSDLWDARGIAISPDGNFGYIVSDHWLTNPPGNLLYIVETETNSIVAGVPIEGEPLEVAITPDGNFAYVTNSSSNTVSVIDIVTYSVVDSIPVGLIPYGVAITPPSELCGESLKTSCNYKFTLEQGAEKTVSIQLVNSGDVSRSATPEVLNPHLSLYVSLLSQDPIYVAPGETKTLPITIDPRDLPAGKYDGILLKVVVDDGSTLYSNITVYVTETEGSELPDLTVNSGNINVITSDPGEPITYVATIHNQGKLPATDVTVQFYDLGVLLEETVIPVVPANGSTNTSITIPEPPSGDRIVEVVIDPHETISELDKSNNKASQIVKIGSPSPIPGNILVTGSLPSTVYAGDLFTVSGSAVYDVYVDGVRYTNYVVKGGSVQIAIKDESGNEWAYGGVHTDINGNILKYLQAPATPGSYRLFITVTDETFIGNRELVFKVVERPSAPQPPPPPPSGTGNWAYDPSGDTWLWTWTIPPDGPVLASDLSVFSENIHFSNNHPDADEEITIFAEILYWATKTDLVTENFPVNIYVTYPGTPKEKVGTTVIPSMSVGSPDFGSRYVYGTWKNRGQGIYIVEVEIDPSYAEENMLNNAATRAIIVGNVESYHGAIQGQVTGSWGGVGNVIIQLYDSMNTSMIGSTLTDDTGHYLFGNLLVGDYQVHIVTPDGHQADAEIKPTAVIDQEISVVDFYLTTPDQICGDLDHDGDVDGVDRNILRAAFGTNVGDAGFIDEADYDEDGNIDYSDYQLWYYCYKDFISN